MNRPRLAVRYLSGLGSERREFQLEGESFCLLSGRLFASAGDDWLAVLAFDAQQGSWLQAGSRQLAWVVQIVRSEPAAAEARLGFLSVSGQALAERTHRGDLCFRYEDERLTLRGGQNGDTLAYLDAPTWRPAGDWPAGGQASGCLYIAARSLKRLPAPPYWFDVTHQAARRRPSELAEAS